MNIYGTLNNIISIIINSYKQKLILQFIRVGINIELLGQPVNFISSVGTGLKDFVKKSNKGFLQGETLKGIFDGGASLIKNTADGTFNSVSQLSSGVSSAILNITNDKEYINQRQIKKMTEKPNDFMEGFGYGITSMASGIFYGVTDIVRKPIEGIKQEKNLSGFGKGILKGIGGVITKPIAGVIDLVSKTSEGFKNTINKDVYSQRVRLPMPLYGKYKFYKEHNKREAEFYYFIKKFFKESFKIWDFISYYNTDDKIMLLVFSNDKVYLIDYDGMESLVNIDLKDISNVKEDNFKVKIFFKRVIKERKSSIIKISKTKHLNDNQAHKISLMFKEILGIDDIKCI
jgi:vacuolar protein sorting-associated protein 13A/C